MVGKNVSKYKKKILRCFEVTYWKYKRKKTHQNVTMKNQGSIWPLEVLARGRFGHFLRKLPNLVAVSYLQTPSPLSWALYSYYGAIFSHFPRAKGDGE